MLHVRLQIQDALSCYIAGAALSRKALYAATLFGIPLWIVNCCLGCMARSMRRATGVELLQNVGSKSCEPC